MNYQYFEADSHATTYDKFRPSPPKDLVQKLVEYVKEKANSPLTKAVDVGCGSGQSTFLLAPFFEEVLGLDPSPMIIEEAKKNNKSKNISFSVSSAEALNLPDESVDLVLCVQAIHWFDLEKFYKEVNRILKKNGVLAVVGYHLPYPSCGNGSDKLAKIVEKYYLDVLGEYVLPPSRKVYLDNYKNEEFNNVPFSQEPMKRFEGFHTETMGTINDLLGYVSTWSAFQNYSRKEGADKALDILKAFEKEVNQEMDSGEGGKFKIIYKYFLLMTRK